MKTNRKTPRCWGRSDSFGSTLVAMLLAISFAASAVGSARAGAVKPPTAQAKDTTAATANGTAIGTLTVDAKEIKLRYVYARERNLLPPDPGGVIDVFIVNQPLTEDMLTRISENQYRGSDKIRGIRLTIRPWKLEHGPGGGEYQSQVMGIGIGGDRGGPVISRVLDQSGTVSDNDRQNQWLKDFKIEHGRVSGNAKYKGEDGIRTTTYSVSFDAPLRPKSAETKPVKVATSAEQFPNFENFMLGKWNIERWREENGLSHTGILSVDERLGGEKLRGVLHIVAGGGGEKVDEEVIITREGTTVHMDGRVISGRWAPDRLAFELKNKLLVGGGSDDRGHMSDMVLRKIP
jgi:uncharacterized protein YijF (DUF1287 family)